MDIKKALVLLYLLALAPRLYQLSATAVYPDEVTWMVKGKESIYALARGNLNYFKSAWWTDTRETYAIGWPVVLLNGLAHVFLAGTGKYSLNWFSDIVASRLPVVFLHALLVPVMYFYSRRWIGEKAAILAAAGYALSPIAIGVDRWVVHDGSVTLFSFWALASFWQGGTLWPGLSLALAFLAKPVGLVVGVGWLVTRRWKQISWAGLSFAVTVTLVWPQSWRQPLVAVGEYLWRQINLTSIPLPNFYAFPGWSYYIFQFIFRTPEVVLVGLVLAMAFFWRRPKANHFWSVGAYATVLLLGLSIAVAKTGIRYALPVLPWIYVAAGWGISQVKSRWLAAVYLTLLLLPLAYHPNYYLYYNRLIGGPEKAKRYDMVGLCLGNKAALSYLDQQQISGSVAILGCADTGSYHTGRALTKDWDRAEIVILESAHRQLFPGSLAVLSLQKRQLLKTTEENGVVTAYIYR